MNIFIDNPLASFRVALTEITFHTHFNKVSDTKTAYYKKDKVEASLKISLDKVSRPYDGETGEITKGEYDEVENLFNEINRKSDLDNLSLSIDPITKLFQLGCVFEQALPFGVHRFLVL